MSRAQFDRDLKLREKQTEDVWVIRVEEEQLNGANAPSFQEHLIRRIMAGNEHVVVDLSEVKHIDRDGIEALKMGLQAVGSDGDLVLCGISEPVMETLRHTLMNRIFGIFLDLDEAVSALTEQQPN